MHIRTIAGLAKKPSPLLEQVCCGVLRCVEVCCAKQMQDGLSLVFYLEEAHWGAPAVCCIVLQCVEGWYSVLQCDAVCCSMMQCVAECCAKQMQDGASPIYCTNTHFFFVLQCVAVFRGIAVPRIYSNRHIGVHLQCVVLWCIVLQGVAGCCSVMQCDAVWCMVLHCIAVCYSVLQGDAGCCSVMQCDAVCCSVLQYQHNTVWCSVLRKGSARRRVSHTLLQQA